MYLVVELMLGKINSTSAKHNIIHKDSLKS